MSETTDLLQRLKAHRLSQLEIARRTGIPQPRLSRWANGTTPTGADDALKLAALVAELDAAPPPAEPTPAPSQEAA